LGDIRREPTDAGPPPDPACDRVMRQASYERNAIPAS